MLTRNKNYKRRSDLKNVWRHTDRHTDTQTDRQHRHKYRPSSCWGVYCAAFHWLYSTEFCTVTLRLQLRTKRLWHTHTHGLQVCTGHWLQSLSSIQESLASMGARRNFYKVQPSLSSPFLLFSFPSLPLRSPPPFPIHPFLSSLLHCAVPYLPRSVNPLNPATDFGWTESGSEYSIYSFQWGKVPYAPAWGRPCRALKTRERKTWD